MKKELEAYIEKLKQKGEAEIKPYLNDLEKGIEEGKAWAYDEVAVTLERILTDHQEED